MAKSKFSTNEEALSMIFKISTPLFAKHGFSGVSIRQVATAVGVSIATIYHHFPDKKALYLAVIEESYKDKGIALDEVFQEEKTDEEQLKCFICSFTKLIASDDNFRLLLQRELIEADSERLFTLVNKVFLNHFESLMALSKRISSKSDPHMTAISVISLIFYHLESTPVRAFFPGAMPEHNDPEFIAEHVCNLLMNGVFQC